MHNGHRNARSRKVWKPRALGLDFSNRYEISHAPRQQRCHNASQISERAIHSLKAPMARLRDFTRFGGKTSFRLVNRGTVTSQWWYDIKCTYTFIFDKYNWYVKGYPLRVGRHIYESVSWNITGSANGLPPVWRHIIAWTNTEIAKSLFSM